MPTTTLLHLAHAAPTCGPSFGDAELAQALLLVLPLFLLVTPLLRRMTATWRGPWARDQQRGHRAVRLFFWATTISALANLPGADSGTFGLVVLAAWLAGASFLVQVLVGWRLLIHRAPQHAAWLPPVVVTAGFAVTAWAARIGTHDLGDGAFLILLLPGVAGFAPIALWIALGIEARVRGWWCARHASAV